MKPHYLNPKNKNVLKLSCSKVISMKDSLESDDYDLLFSKKYELIKKRGRLNDEELMKNDRKLDKIYRKLYHLPEEIKKAYRLKYESPSINYVDEKEEINNSVTNMVKYLRIGYYLCLFPFIIFGIIGIKDFMDGWYMVIIPLMIVGTLGMELFVFPSYSSSIEYEKKENDRIRTERAKKNTVC